MIRNKLAISSPAVGRFTAVLPFLCYALWGAIAVVGGMVLGVLGVMKGRVLAGVATFAVLTAFGVCLLYLAGKIRAGRKRLDRESSREKDEAVQ